MPTRITPQNREPTLAISRPRQPRPCRSRFIPCIASPGISRTVQRLTVGNRKRANIFSVNKAGADPTIIGPIAIQRTGHHFPAHQALHESLCLSARTCRCFRTIHAIQTHRRASHHDRVDIPHNCHAAFNAALRKDRKRKETHGKDQGGHKETIAEVFHRLVPFWLFVCSYNRDRAHVRASSMRQDDQAVLVLREFLQYLRRQGHRDRLEDVPRQICGPTGRVDRRKLRGAEVAKGS